MSTRKKKSNSRPVVAGALGFATILGPDLAFSQSATSDASAQTLEEVVVTAERHQVSAQKVAAAISVRNGDDMLKAGKLSLASILEDVPGITGGAAASTAGTIGGGTDTPSAGLVIRGIPSNVGAGGSTAATAPAAAIYVDGIYNGVGGGYDIDHVEVLRGPQGTLYGRSATAGMVAIKTRDPDLKSIGGNGTIEAGNFGLQHYTAVLNLPIVSDTLAVRVAGNRYQRDGFINGGDGAVTSNDGKIKLLYRPSGDISLLVGAAFQDNVNHSGGRGIATSSDPRQASYGYSPVGQVKTTNRQYWAELNVNVGFATLTYQPALRTWTQDGVLHGLTPIGVLTQPVTTPKDHFMTHELRLSSKPDSRLVWEAGVVYYKNDLDSTNTSKFNDVMAFGVVDSRQTEDIGAFAQATYPLTDTFRVTAGLRYDQTKVAVTESFQIGPFLVPPGAPLPPPFLLTGDAGKRDFSNLTYKLRLEKDVTPTSMLYASVSTGFSPGDVVVSAACPASISAVPPCPLELKAETLTSYELGTKNRFLGDTLQLNADVFYSSYGSFQSAAINVNQGLGPPSFAPLASPMKSYGLEAEMNYKVTQADLLDVSFSWINSRYVNKPAIFAQFVAEDTVTDTGLLGTSGPIPVNASVGYQHIFRLPGGSKLALRAQALYLSSHDGHLNALQKTKGEAPNVHIDSATLGNVSATWMPSDRFSVSGYVRNVTDHQYFNQIILDASGPAIQYQQAYNDPRTYGVALNVTF